MFHAYTNILIAANKEILADEMMWNIFGRSN